MLKKSDYQKLLKMDFNEIAEFLGESAYKEQIDRFAPKMHGAQLLEASLLANLEGTFAKLKRISPPKLAVLIDEFLKRRDMADIKTILRAKYMGLDAAYAMGHIGGGGTLSREFMVQLLDEKSVSAIIEKLEFIDASYREQACTVFEEKKSLMALENVLDTFYYNNLLIQTKRIMGQGKLFKDFLLTEIVIRNLLTIIRLKRAGVKQEEIEPYIFFTENKKEDALFKKLLKATDLEGVFAFLAPTPYGRIIEAEIETYKKTGSLIELETRLNTYLLHKVITQARYNPLTLDVIFGYLFSKENEVRNLKTIIKGKQLDVPLDFIEKSIVI